MNILVTGIHGFIGNNLVTSLKKQHTIYGLDIVSPQKEGIVKTFAWNELDSIFLSGWIAKASWLGLVLGAGWVLASRVQQH